MWHVRPDVPGYAEVHALRMAKRLIDYLEIRNAKGASDTNVSSGIVRAAAKHGELLGRLAAAVNVFPVVYIFTVFVLIPLVCLGLSTLIVSSVIGAVFGWLVIVGLFVASSALMYWYYKKDGKAKVEQFLQKRREAGAQRRRNSARA